MNLVVSNGNQPQLCFIQWIDGRIKSFSLLGLFLHQRHNSQCLLHKLWAKIHIPHKSKFAPLAIIADSSLLIFILHTTFLFLLQSIPFLQSSILVFPRPSAFPSAFHQPLILVLPFLMLFPLKFFTHSLPFILVFIIPQYPYLHAALQYPFFRSELPWSIQS